MLPTLEAERDRLLAENEDPETSEEQKTANLAIISTLGSEITTLETSKDTAETRLDEWAPILAAHISSLDALTAQLPDTETEKLNAKLGVAELTALAERYDPHNLENSHP